MYHKMLQKGYFEEVSNECIIDCAAPEEVHNLKYKLMTNFNSIDDFLSNDVSNDYSEYLKYILHHINFIITDKFIKKYDKPSTEVRVLGLKRKK